MLQTIEEKDEEADGVITQTAVSLAVAGALNPIPLVGDVGIIVGGWASMLYRLGRIYEARYDKDWLEKALLEILKSSGWYGLGTALFISAVTFIKWTGVGIVPAMLVNALLNAAFTIAVGEMYKESWRVGEEPNEAMLATRIRSSVEFAKNREARARAKKIYDEARKGGKTREQALERVIRSMKVDLSNA